MGILWEDDAWQEYLDWQTQDKKTLRRINKLIKDIQRTPFDGIGHPEPLSGNLSGWWSRHIDEKNRIVYKTVGNQTTIVSCHGHYNDK
ncbi:MAG: Txe/YoeB family addiction module toxin [Dorea sp.]|jgi:toxin YoeB|uniref:Txe/YoeB family addiction module toxin n=1 Tax=Sporofaciens sp. JLR.KK001 TaxID=3112621 RepID=UPI00216C2D0B|nr:Txe/YoeB family addiction module toxin [Dorea sp.]